MPHELENGHIIDDALTLELGLFAALFGPAFAVSLLALANAAGWLEPAAEARDGHMDTIETHG